MRKTAKILAVLAALVTIWGGHTYASAPSNSAGGLPAYERADHHTAGVADSHPAQISTPQLPAQGDYDRCHGVSERRRFRHLSDSRTSIYKRGELEELPARCIQVRSIDRIWKQELIFCPTLCPAQYGAPVLENPLHGMGSTNRNLEPLVHGNTAIGIVASRPKLGGVLQFAPERRLPYDRQDLDHAGMDEKPARAQLFEQSLAPCGRQRRECLESRQFQASTTEVVYINSSREYGRTADSGLICDRKHYYGHIPPRRTISVDVLYAGSDCNGLRHRSPSYAIQCKRYGNKVLRYGSKGVQTLECNFHLTSAGKEVSHV